MVATWLDPTRSALLRREATPTFQHAIVDFAPGLAQGAAETPEAGRPTPAGLHAAAMAYAALRRRVAQVDPRELIPRIAYVLIPLSFAPSLSVALRHWNRSNKAPS